MGQIDKEFNARLDSLITSMGHELVGCETLPAGRQLLFRIYIDNPKEKGVTIDDCSAVSRQVSAWMDAENLFQDRYLLEVSSPGINRPLFTLAQMAKYQGKRIKIKLHASDTGRRLYKATLLRVEGEKIYILPDEMPNEMVLSFSQIAKANLAEDL